MDPWIYQQLADERLVDVPAGTTRLDPATSMLPAQTVRYGDAVDWMKPPDADPVARTAGEENHSNPWLYAGDDADPPGAP